MKSVNQRFGTFCAPSFILSSLFFTVHNEQYAVFVNLSIYSEFILGHIPYWVQSPPRWDQALNSSLPVSGRIWYVNLYLWSEVRSLSLFYKFNSVYFRLLSCRSFKSVCKSNERRPSCTLRYKRLLIKTMLSRAYTYPPLESTSPKNAHVWKIFSWNYNTLHILFTPPFHSFWPKWQILLKAKNHTNSRIDSTRIVLPFKDQKSADTVTDLSSTTGKTMQSGGIHE